MQAQFATLDNQIEHLYIVPRGLARYPSARTYWERRMADRFAASARSACDVVLACEFVRRVLAGGALLDEVQAQVEAQNLGGTCDHFRQAVDESKVAETRLLFAAFADGDLSTWACLNHFDQPHDIPLIRRAT
ncbi:hypothetical protein [Burkholderia stagnalis]